MSSPTSGCAADPFMLRFATPRSAATEMPGFYSSELAVWVIETDQGVVPIVEVANGALVATQSKTFTRVEVDDDDPSSFGAIDTGTFTRVKQEANDDDVSLWLPELATKTEVMQEQDDPDPALYL